MPRLLESETLILFIHLPSRTSVEDEVFKGARHSEGASEWEQDVALRTPACVVSLQSCSAFKHEAKPTITICLTTSRRVCDSMAGPYSQ
jgi:hypothetical protein